LKKKYEKKRFKTEGGSEWSIIFSSLKAGRSTARGRMGGTLLGSVFEETRGKRSDFSNETPS